MFVFGTPRERFSKAFLLLLTVGISLVFLLMIRRFLVAILLAGIFTAMTLPLHRWFLRLVRGRDTVASLLTILFVLVLIVGPLTGFLAVVASQAIDVSQSVGPWLEHRIQQPDLLDRLLDRIPFAERLRPYQNQIIAKVGELASLTGRFLVNRLAAATRGTVSFILNLFVMLYAMFFFLADGRAILDRILYYLPLSSEDERRMTEKFVSVTRATIKGTLVIGIVQGAMAGLAFWAVGITGAAFWSTVMAVLSVIPGIGAALVWVPAAVFLVLTGKVVPGLLLTAWCGLVVGTIDNVIRPRLVGRDTKMSDLLILLSTLGGIFLFGAVGVIIGPIVAALFVTIWEIYGLAFKALLPEIPESNEDPGLA